LCSFQPVFVDASFIYTGQISHKLPAGPLLIIRTKSRAPNLIMLDIIVIIWFSFCT